VLFGALEALSLPPQLEREKEYARQFRQAEIFIASYRTRTHHLPDYDALSEKFSPLFSVDSNACLDPTFEKAPGDVFVISLWRGEWADCFASPSAKTNLTVGPQTVQSWMLYFALHFAFAGAMGFCAWLLWPRREGSSQAVSSS